jgi:hypothetical protein
MPRTPTEPKALDISILTSSPPEGTELRRATSYYNSIISASNDIEPVAKRFGTKMTSVLEKQYSDLALKERELRALREEIEILKGRQKGKRVRKVNKFVYSTEEIRREVVEEEAATAASKSRKTRKRRKIAIEIETREDSDLENIPSESEGDTIVVRYKNVD